ncbi:MAG: RagB/SusD family nutrient uptake outer membrane protein [Bacteroidales bacterium]|nr:RagB/SusD family nutrient uptake outer membrane protein [Bacteroidales bacterium]
MKKTLTLMALAACTILSSCSGMLDRNNPNGPATGTFPASAEEALAGVLVSYKNLGNGSFQQQYNPFPYRFLDHVTDIGCTRSVKLGEWAQFETSSITSQSSVVSSEYTGIYKTAGRIHLVLDKLHLIKDKMDEETYMQFRAELLCLRAFIYDQGCQFYGDIPFIDHCLTLEDYAYARTPREEVIDRILADMDDELLDYLPIQWSKPQWGTVRIGRAAAYALKARICLNWGRFEEAAKYSKKALELSVGVYSLTELDCSYYPTALDGEPDPTPLFGFKAEQGSDEWMWSISFNLLAASSVHHGIYTFASRVHNGAAGGGPTQALMDSFQCTDGKSIVESPLYDWQHPWANRDPRLDLYCLRNDTRCMGIEYSADSRKLTVTDFNTGAQLNNNDVTGNKSEYGPNGKSGPGGYLWRKYCDPAYYGNIVGTSFEDDLDVCLIRYAELLLIDAEANIEMEGGDLARAAADINEVRARVHMPKISAGTREELRTALRYERKVELCNEGFRWFDLRRWKDDNGVVLAATAVNGPQYAPAFNNAIPNGKPVIDKNWIVTYDASKTWDGKSFNLRTLRTLKFTTGRDELWPMPYTEMTTNPLIGEENNNPGY